MIDGSIINHQSSIATITRIINHHQPINPSIVNHESSIINHQSSIINHQSSIITIFNSRQASSIINHHPSSCFQSSWIQSHSHHRQQGRSHHTTISTVMSNLIVTDNRVAPARPQQPIRRGGARHCRAPFALQDGERKAGQYDEHRGVAARRSGKRCCLLLPPPPADGVCCKKAARRCSSGTAGLCRLVSKPPNIP